MNKILLFFCLLTSFFCYPQAEVKLDIADALVIRNLELSYENYISEETSLGISFQLNLAKQNIAFRYNENIMVTPYFRHYFTTYKKWNFFGEAFIGINSGKRESVKDSGDFDIKYTDGAIGIAIGTKYSSTGGMVIDLYGGIGRNLFESNSRTLVPRIGLNIGFRVASR